VFSHSLWLVSGLGKRRYDGCLSSQEVRKLSKKKGNGKGTEAHLEKVSLTDSETVWTSLVV
jgi:hypothetical protein